MKRPEFRTSRLLVKPYKSTSIYASLVSSRNILCRRIGPTFPIIRISPLSTFQINLSNRHSDAQARDARHFIASGGRSAKARTAGRIPSDGPLSKYLRSLRRRGGRHLRGLTWRRPIPLGAIVLRQKWLRGQVKRVLRPTTVPSRHRGLRRRIISAASYNFEARSWASIKARPQLRG